MVIFQTSQEFFGGIWLHSWIQAAAALSNMDNFLTEMSSDSYQLLRMAERGRLPDFFAKRSHYGTQLIGILFSAFGLVLLSWMSFQEIIATENYLYCFGMILEFIAFIMLQVTHPNASPPYRITLGTIGAVLLIIPQGDGPRILQGDGSEHPSGVIRSVLQPWLGYVEKNRWLRFSISADLLDLPDAQKLLKMVMFCSCSNIIFHCSALEVLFRIKTY